MNKTAIIVEHKLEKIIDLVDRIIVMDKGGVVFNGKPVEVLHHYQELMEIGVVAPQMNQIINLLSDHGLASLSPTTCFEDAVRELKAALPAKLPLDKMKETAAGFTNPPAYNKPIIEIRDLHFGYTPEVEVLHGINLDVYEGEFLSIVGQNGSGKTTIVKHFNGLHKPTSGTVRVKGVATSDSTVAKLSQSVGYCIQNPDHHKFSSVVKHDLCYGP